MYVFCLFVCFLLIFAFIDSRWEREWGWQAAQGHCGEDSALYALNQASHKFLIMLNENTIQWMLHFPQNIFAVPEQD